MHSVHSTVTQRSKQKPHMDTDDGGDMEDRGKDNNKIQKLRKAHISNTHFTCRW